jgi:phage baseplate assembly protein gpV
MTALEVGTNSCEVLVEGAPLNPMVAMYLRSVEVDSTMFVPSQFKLVFQSTPLMVLEPGGLQLAVEVIITASYDMAPVPLITGEITSVEVEYEHGETLTIVRGMDRSHRLMRGTQTMAYPDTMASDVVTMLLGEATVPPGEIIPTSNLYEWLTQANVSAWTFIQQLARLENYVAYSDALGLFNFCPMPKPEEAGAPAMSTDVPALPNQLVMGVNLVSLRAVVSAAEQVPTVITTGYDPQMAMPVLGTFPLVPSSSVLLDPATMPVPVGGEFGATEFNDSSRPLSSEGAALTWAESIASDIAGTMAEIEGECLGNPNLLAGEPITLGMCGPPFEGNYICTGARHVFDPDAGGYTTWVTVGGFRDRSLLALSSGSSPDDSIRPTIPGLVIGTVVDNLDPQDLGRVKVMFPWLSAEYISAWARVMQIGASKAGSGFLWVPEIDDEVLLGFDRGSIDNPFVIGGLYNGVTMPMPPPSIDGVVANRRIVSRMGHTLQWNDGPDAMGIHIATAPAEGSPCEIKLDGEEIMITINSDNSIQIKAAAQLEISTEGELTIKGSTITIGDETTASLTIGGSTISMGTEAESISIGSAGEVSIGGTMISLGGG